MAFEVPPPEALPAAAQAAVPRAVSLVSLVLLIVSVGFAVVGQLTLKSAMNRVGRIGQQEMSAPGETILRAVKEPRLWVGLALFGVSALFWLVVLSRVPLSVAYPFVGLSYIAIVASARLFLHEHVPLLRWIGVVVVALGIAIVGLSFRRATGA
ncbi:MAG: EamA family transporter [Actinomycetota bacterium]